MGVCGAGVIHECPDRAGRIIRADRDPGADGRTFDSYGRAFAFVCA